MHPVSVFPMEVVLRLIVDEGDNKNTPLDERVKFIFSCMLVNKPVCNAISPCMERVKQETIIVLLGKYSKYASTYYQSWNDAEVHVPSILYDALASGCDLPFAEHSQVFSPIVERDIKKIVQLLPCSMQWNFGILRCDNFVPPLLMACLNENMPPQVIRFLLQAGANPYRPLFAYSEENRRFDYYGSHLISLYLEDNKGWLNKERASEIEQIFEECIGPDAPQEYS